MDKLLIVGPSWVGDTVVAQALFMLLRQKLPQLRIDVLAPSWTFPLLARMPEVTETLPMPLTHGELNIKQRYQIGLSLRQAQYDAAIVLPNSFKSALIPFFAKIPRRIGWHGEARYVVLNDRRKHKKHYPLLVQQYLALGLAKHENIPSVYSYPKLQVTQDQQQKIAQKLKIKHDQKILAICPGAAFGTAKCWPAAYYAEVAKTKMAAGWQVWICGAAQDRVIATEIMSLTDNQCINFTGRLALDETVDLLSLCHQVLTNDSGLMHVAAALGKAVIALYGPTSPGFTPPLANNAKVLQLDLICQPCFKRSCPLQHHRCMRDLLPSKVLAALND